MIKNNINYRNLSEYVGNKKLILFGASLTGAQAINMINDSIPISFICDNDKEKHGKYLFGIEIKSPEYLINENNNDIVALISSINYAEIQCQLYDLGITDIITHKELARTTQSNQPQASPNVVNTVGKEFYIDPADEKIKKNIATLYDIIEDEKFSKELLSQVIKSRMYKKDGFDMDFILAGHINHPAYFSLEIFGDNVEDEIIIDGGLEDSNDFNHFHKILGNRLKKIYGFEPSQEHFKRIKIDLVNNQIFDYIRKEFICLTEVVDIKLFPLALSTSSGKLFISNCVTSSSGISGDEVGCTSIDEIVDQNDRITLIKLDIEGAELDALKGARQIILKDKPRLVVCLYHNPSDLWEIPMYIKDLYPEYKLFIRPHCHLKTILELHAICK